MPDNEVLAQVNAEMLAAEEPSVVLDFFLQETITAIPTAVIKASLVKRFGFIMIVLVINSLISYVLSLLLSVK